jgi:hypothetical protein
MGAEKDMQAGAEAFGFARCTSRSDPAGVGRAELAHLALVYIAPCALLEFSQARFFEP